MVFVVSNTEKPLMPTSNYKARRLLKKGRVHLSRNAQLYKVTIIQAGEESPFNLKKGVTGEMFMISVCRHLS